MIKSFYNYSLYIAMMALLLLAIGQIVIVIMRFVFSIGLIWLQDTLFFGFTIAILWAVCYFYHDHYQLRIDIFYQKFSQSIQQYIDIFVQLLVIMPFCLLLLWACYDFALQSIIIGEASSVYGGLSFIYILKLLLFIFPLQLFLSCCYLQPIKKYKEK